MCPIGGSHVRISLAWACVALMGCAKNGYIVQIEVVRIASFDQRVMSLLEEQAARDGFTRYGDRTEEKHPEEVVSPFIRQFSSDFADRLELYVIWRGSSPDGSDVLIRLMDPEYGNVLGRRSRLEEIGRHFEAILVHAFSSGKVTVERSPMNHWIF